MTGGNGNSNSPDLKAAFGRRVRQLRVSRGMTQENLALGSGIDRTYMGSIERGERNVSLERMSDIASALGVSLYELFDGLLSDC